LATIGKDSNVLHADAFIAAWAWNVHTKELLFELFGKEAFS
jgi:hypothetical protein